MPALKPPKKDQLDDLFGGEEDFQPSRPPPKPVATQPASKPPTSGGLFSDEDDTDDLFSGLGATRAAPVPSKEKEAKAMPPQKKKLPGAVSMFGAGGDPSALAAAAAAKTRGERENKKGELNLHKSQLATDAQYLHRRITYNRRTLEWSCWL